MGRVDMECRITACAIGVPIWVCAGTNELLTIFPLSTLFGHNATLLHKLRSVLRCFDAAYT